MKEQWPAWNKWNPEYFRDQLGDKEVRVAGWASVREWVYPYWSRLK